MESGKRRSRCVIHFHKLDQNMATPFHSRFQYYDYDFNSFIADVGGFLGLLLGHSIYSFYQVAADWMKKMNISRSSKARKRSDAK